MSKELVALTGIDKNHPKPKFYWTTRLNPYSFEYSPTSGSMWFPYAEWFMTKYPWLTVRVFYFFIKVKEGVDRVRKTR